MDTDRLGGVVYGAHVTRPSFSPPQLPNLHDAVVLESTTILISSVFATIFWVDLRIGLVLMTVRLTRWSCCILFYEPAPGSLAFYLTRST